MISNEDKYICKRKWKACKLSVLFFLMRIFPIKRKKIVFSTFEGEGGFCCNPRYIAEELHRRNKHYEMIWLVHDLNKKFPDYIHAVKDTPWNMAFHLSTAHIWIDNYRKPYGVLKRKTQIYIQTWHASIGFKAVGRFRGKEFPKIARIVSEWDSGLVDYLLSNSDYCTRIYPQKLLYEGPVLKTGSPRVDCLINDKKILHSLIRKRYGLEGNVNILLFAPTFRGGNQKDEKHVIATESSIDFVRLIKNLSKRFGGEWIIFLRLHPQLSAKMKEMPVKVNNNRLIDVSQADDISELIGACDGVITDYSSCAFDACFGGIPVFLYADDVAEYIESRGKFMWKKEEIPFSVAENNNELMDNINKFNYTEYLHKIQLFMKKNGVVEDGKASGRVVDEIEKMI